MKPDRIAAATTAIWASAPAAFACTLCDSDVATQVRSTVLGPDLWANLAGLMAPIPALVLAIVAVHHLSR